MKEIPTAAEFLKNNNVVGMIDLLSPLIVEFAKLHVEAQREAIKEKATTKLQTFGNPNPEQWSYTVDEKSIDNAYPLTNVK